MYINGISMPKVVRQSASCHEKMLLLINIHWYKKVNSDDMTRKKRSTVNLDVLTNESTLNYAFWLLIISHIFVSVRVLSFSDNMEI